MILRSVQRLPPNSTCKTSKLMNRDLVPKSIRSVRCPSKNRIHTIVFATPSAYNPWTLSAVNVQTPKSSSTSPLSKNGRVLVMR